MAQPVKLSDALVLDARLEGEMQQRSIAGQVEYWARLGKLLDALLDGRTRNEALRKSGTASLSSLVASVGSAEGDARLKEYLDHEPFPHFEPHPTRKGILIRTDEDGSRSEGRFVNRQFVASCKAATPGAIPARRKRTSPVSRQSAAIVLRQNKARAR